MEFVKYENADWTHFTKDGIIHDVARFIVKFRIPKEGSNPNATVKSILEQSCVFEIKWGTNKAPFQETQTWKIVCFIDENHANGLERLKSIIAEKGGDALEVIDMDAVEEDFKDIAKKIIIPKD